jgi:hypothetical protein
MHKLYTQHLLECGEQRMKLYDHRAKAKRAPHMYAFIMVDGMTKRSTALPRHAKAKAKCWESKEEDAFPGHENALMGSHIQNVGWFCDFHSENIADNANFLVDTIHRNITRLQQYNVSRGLPQPAVLYLQLDNVSTNKGTLVFKCLSWLVASGVFAKIKVGYLVVGHTHEYIDQFFSRWVLLCMCRYQ